MMRLVILLVILLVTLLHGAAALAEKPETFSGNDTGDAATETNADGAQTRYRDLDDLFTLYQPYLGNIGPYQPIYFLVGTEPEKSKFQLSLKYRFFNPNGSWGRSHPWLRGFHIAYTQTSLWDLESDSKPFEDTSYKPEFFYLTSNLNILGHSITNCFFQTGYQHESNGQGGLNSRATDMIYIRPIFILYHERSQLGISIAPKLWLYLSNEDKTLKDYRGYFDLVVTCGKADSLVAQSSFRWAKEGPSVEVDLSYPLHQILFGNLDIYLQVQYTNALAETLLNFRKRTQALRIGFALVR